MTVAAVNTWEAFLRGTRLDHRNDDHTPALKPLWTVNLEDDESILEWHKKVSSAMETHQNRRTNLYVRNRDLYAGFHSNPGGRTGLIGDPQSEFTSLNRRVPELTINHSFELTEQWVSKLSRFSTNVNVLPQNTEEGDRNAARASQRYATHLADINDFKSLFIRFIRDSKIGGESYIFIDFNPNIGDLHPDAKKAKDLGKRITLKDENGKVIIGENREELLVDTRQRVGDLEYKLRSVPEVLVQPKKRWKDVEWVREVELVDVDELKRRFPKKSGLLTETILARDGQGNSSGTFEHSNDVFVHTYWHKRVDGLDAGRKIILVNNVVLVNEVNPFSGAPLPIVRLTDIDIETELHGWSFLNNIATPQIVLNRLYTLWFTNIALGSHLYWLIPANARVARDKIRNASSVLVYHGDQAPQIATFRTVQSDLMQLIEKIEQRMLTVSRIQSTSRGELPPNVEAGVAIGILEEQENQAATPDIKKVNAAVEKLFKISLGIAGDMYEQSDGRTSRILGKEGEFLLENLDSAKLSGPYDIRVKKTTAFSQSKAQMMQEIIQLEAMRPGFLSDEELYDLLDLGDRDKFYSIATSARRAAEFENEKLKDGENVPESTKDEFLLVHWNSHVTEIQKPSYKISASDKVKAGFEAHIKGTELWLVEKAKTNIALTERLLQLEYFPIYYKPKFSMPQILLALQSGAALPALGQEEEVTAPVELTPPGGELTPEAAAAESTLPGEELAVDQGLNGELPEETGIEL